MSKIEQAVSCFKGDFSCSQAMLSTYGEQFGLDRELALRVAGAFGGGMARMGGVCGAVTGAFMVIGLKYGRVKPEDEDAKETTYGHVRDFVDRFRSRNGSIICKELLGHDIGTPEGMKAAREQDLFGTVCADFVRDAAEILERIL